MADQKKEITPLIVKSFQIGYAKRKLEEDHQKLYNVQHEFFLTGSSEITLDKVGRPKCNQIDGEIKKIKLEEMTETKLPENFDLICAIQQDLINASLDLNQLLFEQYKKKCK